MRCFFGFVSIVVVSICVGTNASGAQSEIGGRAARSNGELAVDVTVRARPQATADAVSELPVGTAVRVASGGKVLGWMRIEAPKKGWIPVEAFTARADVGNDSVPAARRRSRSAGTPGTVRSSARGGPGTAGAAGNRSDAELMLDALTASRGESPNAARIARVVAETAQESKENQAKAALQSSWKDPFVDESEPPLVVRPRRAGGGGRSADAAPGQPDEDVNDLRAARRETARARADAAAARAEAAAVRADAAHVKAELARREASAAHADAMAAKSDAAAARAGCVDAVGGARRAMLVRGTGWRQGSLREAGRTEHVRKPIQRAAAWNPVGRVTMNEGGGGGSRSGGRPRRGIIAAAESRAEEAPAVAPSPEPTAAEPVVVPSPPPAAPPVSAPLAAAPPTPTAPAAPAGPALAKSGSWTKGILVVPITPLSQAR